MTDLMTSKEAAAYLRVGLTTLYGLVRGGEISHFDCGGLYRYARVDLDAYLSRRRIPSTAERAASESPSRPSVVPLPEIISVFTGRPLRVSAR